jgi:hypothetical protein
MSSNFLFHPAFGEISPDGCVHGVWVGEHGFLLAVFVNLQDAESFCESNFNKGDYAIDKITLDKSD